MLCDERRRRGGAVARRPSADDVCCWTPAECSWCSTLERGLAKRGRCVCSSGMFTSMTSVAWTVGVGDGGAEWTGYVDT